MKLFLILLFIASIIFSNSYAETPILECGIYSFKGTVKIINQKNYTLIINDSTKNEIQLNLNHEQELIFAPYLNKGVSGKIEISSITDGKVGAIAKSSDLENAILETVTQKKEKNLMLIQKLDCKN